jgi:tetratricopeptide (TPR) repeat protein
MQCTAGKYRFHDLVRSYANSLARTHDSPADLDIAVEGLLEYYLAATDRAAGILQPGREQVRFGPSRSGGPWVPAPDPAIVDAESALVWFDREYSNIVSALRCAIRLGMDRYSAYMPRALVHYLQLRGRVDDLLELLEAAVGPSRRLGDATFERLNLMNLAAPYWHLGRPWEALEHLARALELATADGDARGRAECLLRIGAQNEEIGQYITALGHYEEALKLYRRLGSPRGECTTLINLSSALSTLGRHAEALQAAREAERISQRLGDLDAKMFVRVNQANALTALGRLDEALHYVGQACELGRRTGAKDGRAVTLTKYTAIYIRMGRYAQAAETGANALEAAEAIHRPAITAMVENLLATVDLRCGDAASALERHARAARIAEKIELRIELARSLDGAGRALFALGDLAAAQGSWRAALEHYEQMGIPEAESVRAALGEAPPVPAEIDYA